MRVVLAEDSAPTRRLVEVALQRAGHVVTAVGDGQAAWEAVQQDFPQLLLIDWQMPGLDGLEVCRRLRALPGGDEPFVLMVTSRDDEGALPRALDAGVDDYIMKPVAPANLLARLVIAERRIGLAAGRRRAEAELARAQWLAGIGQTAVALQHEINNPLAAAMAELGLSAETPCPPDVQERLDIVMEQLRRIAAIVRRVGAMHDPRTVEYLPGASMLDLTGSSKQ